MTTLFLLLLAFRLSAPDLKELIIVSPEPIRPYEKIIYAIGMVEGNCDTLAYNPLEEATGYFQIRPIRLNDYNKRTSSNYKLRDMFDFKISKKVFMYYACKIGENDRDRIIRDWNGSGRMTYEYLKKVKKYL